MQGHQSSGYDVKQRSNPDRNGVKMMRYILLRGQECDPEGRGIVQCGECDHGESEWLEESSGYANLVNPRRMDLEKIFQ